MPSLAALERLRTTAASICSATADRLGQGTSFRTWSWAAHQEKMLEGILTASRYGAMLQSLRRDHAGTSAFFYLDVSLPETLRRHDSRPQRSEFTPDQMREWYRERDLLPDGCETVIGEDSPLEASVRQVLRQARLTPAQTNQ